jgi:hypothetical protein
LERLPEQQHFPERQKSQCRKIITLEELAPFPARLPEQHHLPGRQAQARRHQQKTQCTVASQLKKNPFHIWHAFQSANTPSSSAKLKTVQINGRHKAQRPQL